MTRPTLVLDELMFGCVLLVIVLLEDPTRPLSQSEGRFHHFIL